MPKSEGKMRGTQPEGRGKTGCLPDPQGSQRRHRSLGERVDTGRRFTCCRARAKSAGGEKNLENHSVVRDALIWHQVGPGPRRATLVHLHNPVHQAGPCVRGGTPRPTPPGRLPALRRAAR
jgi:hypothetical protein